LDTLREGVARLRDQPVDDMVHALVSTAAGVGEPTSADLADAARVYAALRAIVDSEDLHALSIRCFDLVMEQKTTACYALSRLNDEGIVAGCEGDLVSAVGMLWAQQLVGTIPWMANPSRLQAADNALWLAHCTVPCSMVRSYRLRSHFESGVGVGIAGQFALGPVTVFRLGGSNLERLWVAEGELDATGSDEHLCRTQVRVRLDRGHVRDLLMSPLGNHLLVMPSRHAERLRGWWERVILPRVARASS
jgi:L-fucose isomerase-like protein